MKIVTVIPLRKGLLKNDLTYFTSKDIAEGDVVKIPLRGKEALGLVISASDVGATKSDIKGMSFNLKKILEVKGPSIWEKKFLEAVLDTCKYFAVSRSAGATALIPTIFRENYDILTEFKKAPMENDPTVENLRPINRNLHPEKLLLQIGMEDRISFYKNLVRGAFVAKHSVFIVLPTERDISVFSQSLSKGIENFTFSLHASVKPKKLIEDYGKIVSSDHPILILGTAPFLSIPRNDIGTIVVEHESSPAYKMQYRPQLDLRIFAEILASKIGARFILGDSMLRFESLAKKETQFWSLAQPLSFRSDFKGKIIVSEKYNENSKNEVKNKKFRILSKECKSRILEAVKGKRSVFIFSLRKGLATYTICRDCQEPIFCDKCVSPVALYTSRDKKRRMFMCNRCHTEKDPLMTCPNCGSWNLIPLGIGTDTVHEEIKRIFLENKVNAKVFKLDKESAKTSKGAEKMVGEFEESSGSVLIGTELALFYLEKKIPFSVVASFDSLYSIPSFKMSEKIIRLLSSIISKTDDVLFIETKNESDSGILAVKNDMILQFVRDELNEREELNYPPFARFIKITHLGGKQETAEAKKTIQEFLKD